MTIPGAPGTVQVPDSVFITDGALETIEENAFAEAPLECCGLLLGRFAPPERLPAPPGPLRLVKGANPPVWTANGADEAIHSAYYVIESDESDESDEAVDSVDEVDSVDAADAARAIEDELGLGGGGGFSIPLPDVLTIEEAVPTRNASSEPTRYLVEPEDHFRVLRHARSRGLDIVGAYHSHAITPPVPSETDLAEAHPHFLYVIASPDWDTGEGCDIRAWWLVDGNFQEVTIVPVA
jgi:proteasome lid subunit RPN8/RPN11